MKLWLLIFAAALVLLPQMEGLRFGIHLFDSKRLAQILIISSGLLLIACGKATALIPQKAKYYWSGLILMLCVSILGAAVPELAALETANMLGLILVSMLISQQPQAAQKVLQLASITAALYLLAAVAHLINSRLLGLSQQVVPVLPGFSNIRAFGHWQTWTLAIIGALPFYRQYLAKIPPYWLWAIAIGWWFLFYIAGGRGTALAILSAAIFIQLIHGRAALPWLKTLLTAALIGNLLAWGWTELATATGPGLARADSSGRFEIWSETWQMFMQQPWFGVGPMHYAHHSSLFGSPHNVALLSLAENGIFVSVTLAAGMFWLLRKILKHHPNTLQQPLWIGFSASCIAALVHSFFSGIQLAPYSQLWLVLIVGACIQLYQQNNVSDQPQYAHSVATARFEKVLATALACILIAGVAYSIIATNIPDPWADIIGKHYPRFWSHGQF